MQMEQMKDEAERKESQCFMEICVAGAIRICKRQLA